MIILGLAESFKTMNQPDPVRAGPSRPDPIQPDLTVTLFDGSCLGKCMKLFYVKIFIHDFSMFLELFNWLSLFQDIPSNVIMSSIPRM